MPYPSYRKINVFCMTIFPLYTPPMPFFYLARCSDGTLYSGSCKDPAAREAVHNSRKGAKYTRSRLPIRMVYSEEFPTLGDALRREAEVKKWRKERKEALFS